MSKKTEILHAAMQLFAAKGYEKSSMAEVAAKPVPKMEATMVLDTKKAKELMAQAVQRHTG